MATGYKSHRHGSVRAKLHECLDTNGEAATLALATQLGVKEQRIRRWIKKWLYVPNTSTSRRVVWKFDPERFGALIVKGDEVSSVRWETGETEYVTNENYTFIGERQ